jgi:dTMP kinase
VRGRFISFEGIDGCGKSTQAAMLARHLSDRGTAVVHTREPGGTPVGEGIREALLASESVTPLAEAHLFAAARAELVATVISPALEAGRWVVCDRFIDSSLTYQGVARGLGIDAVWELNRGALGDCLPDLTVLLVISGDEAAQRRGAEADRIEREGNDFQRRVAEGYVALAERFAERIVAIDGSGDVATVHGRVIDAVGP